MKAVAAKKQWKKPERQERGIFSRLVRLLVLAIIAIYSFFAVTLFAFKWVVPFTTSVQIERRVQSWFNKKPYQKRRRTVPLSEISPDLQHAIIAAEDGRFYKHHGIDWTEVSRVLDQEVEEGQVSRGASTITQQLVKNLYLTTYRSWVRKGVEATLAYMAEGILGKRRILELYLNIIEWGPGVYGAEAAARFHYGVSASRLTRDQASRLAACVPSPRRRRPARMDHYSADIQNRMRQMGW